MLDKSRGKYIIVKFDQPLLNETIDAVEAFTVKGDEYKYVQGPSDNGPLLERGYEVAVVDYAEPQNADSLEDWQGNKHQVEANGEVLKLEQEGEPAEVINGWNTESFATGNPATGTRGYRFSPNQDCRIKSLRMMPTESESTVHLWDADNQTLIASKTVATVAGEWVEMELDEPISVEASKEYIVSANYTNGNSYYRNSSASQSEFNELQYIGHFTGGSHDTFPTSSVSWANAVDVVFAIGETVYFENGNFTYMNPLQDGSVASSEISWQEDKPEGTDMKVFVSLDGTNWIPQLSGDPVACLSEGQQLADATLHIKAELSTEGAKVTPSIWNLSYQIRTPEDSQFIKIELETIEGRIQNVIGDVTVSYDPTKGNLFGAGGDVEAFSETFTPEDLDRQPLPIGHTERVSVAPSVEVELVAIDYQEAFNDGEQLSVTAVSVEAELIHIDIINP